MVQGVFEVAQCHARRARDLRRIAAGRAPAMRRLLQGHARAHEAMVRAYASIVVIEACEARMSDHASEATGPRPVLGSSVPVQATWGEHPEKAARHIAAETAGEEMPRPFGS